MTKARAMNGKKRPHILIKTNDAVPAPEFERRGGQWQPHVHWIVSTCDEIESSFVQSLLDKYAFQVKAYSILPFLDKETCCIELQFHDDAVGEQCRAEYTRGFRKGGIIPKKRKAELSGKPKRAKKRLLSNRMYLLPDGEHFFYYAKWDGHGNLIGKVYDEIEGQLRNKIIHRSLLEEAQLIAKGEEPWVLESAHQR